MSELKKNLREIEVSRKWVRNSRNSANTCSRVYILFFW